MESCYLCSKIPLYSLPDLSCHSYIFIGDDVEMPLFYSEHKENEKNGLIAWHPSLESLKKSEESCSFCTLIRKGYQKWSERFEAFLDRTRSDLRFLMNKIPATDKPLWIANRPGGGLGLLVLVETVTPREPNKMSLLLLTGVYFSSHAGMPAANGLPLLWPSFHSDAGSKNSLESAISFIKQCDEEHQDCKRLETPLPSRVLDVSLSGDRIRLLEPKDMLGKYACLSYCWGKSMTFTTSRKTIASRKEGFEVSQLPKTLSEAVIVARELDIPYLWVDSLCICQDDQDDWARESAQMADIYSNAYLTIAANHANSASGGLFNIRPQQVSCQLSLPKMAQPVTASLIANSDSGHNAGWIQDFPEEPLSQRGWALQERLLSKRILHFNSTQMYYECAQGVLSEDGCLSFKAAQHRSNIIHSNERLDAAKIYNGWHNTIASYGSRSLTIATDKLPALSGIASRYQQLLGAQYVAGLWSDRLIEGLAWQGRDQEHKKREPDQPYTGPSWSWAGFHAIAIGATQLGKEVAQVLEWDVDLKNSRNPFGEINSAWIRLRAPLTTLIAEENQLDQHNRSLKKHGTNPRPRLRTCYREDEYEFHADVSLECPEEIDDWRNQDLKLLLLYASLKKNATAAESIEGFGLVVTAAEGRADSSTLRRVGSMLLPRAEMQAMVSDESARCDVTLV